MLVKERIQKVDISGIRNAFESKQGDSEQRVSTQGYPWALQKLRLYNRRKNEILI